MSINITIKSNRIGKRTLFRGEQYLSKAFKVGTRSIYLILNDSDLSW